MVNMKQLKMDYFQSIAVMIKIIYIYRMRI